MRTAREWEQRLHEIARDAGKSELNPVLVTLCADQLCQWEKLTEELTTRPALVDEWTDLEKGRIERSVPPEFSMQSKTITAVRGLLRDLGLIDLAADPLKKLRNRLLAPARN